MSRTWRSILSAAKVGLHDSLIFQNNFRCPFGELFSMVEDENLFGEIHDDLHVMLYDQDSLTAGAEIADGAQEIVEQTSINPGGRLVKKNQIRIDHQDPRELQESLLAVGKVPGKFPAQSIEFDESQELYSPAVGCFPVLPRDNQQIF